MKKLSLILALLTAFSFAARAQDFTPYPFIQLQGGASYDFGEADFAKLLSPAAQVAVGYRFDDFWGARLAVDGWQAKHDSPKTGTIYGFKFVQPNLDLILDWSSAFFGYRPDRPFTIYSFVGGGVAFGLENKEATDLAPAEGFSDLWKPVKAFWSVRPGVGFDIRLGSRVSLNLECDAHFLPETFDSRICTSSNGFDVHMAVLGGLKFNLGWRPRKVVPAAPVATYQPPAPKPEPKKEEPKKEEPKKEYTEPAPKPAPQPVVQQPIEQGADIDIFFDLNKSVIREDQIPTLNQLVNFMRNTPAAKVKLDGYADRGTGTPAINQTLSEDRVIAVRQYLVSRGIDADRITTAAHGDTIQPFTGEKNRAVTCRIR